MSRYRIHDEAGRIRRAAVAASVMALAGLVAAVGGDPEQATAGPVSAVGRAYVYPAGILEAVERLIAGGGWSAATPARNDQGLLEVAHEKTGLVFVVVPGGRFWMGSADSEADRDPNEGPLHRVTVPTFLLCRTECPQAVWEKGGGTNGSKWKAPHRPVETVDWDQSREWCRRNGLRLPSESEWEYGCRAGSRGRWCFGDDEQSLPDYAWYFVDSGPELLPLDTVRDMDTDVAKWGCQTHPVRVKKPNAWGLYDMHGNVLEWVEDAFHKSYEGAPSDGRAWTEGGEEWYPGTPDRVFRGGDWGSAARHCRSAFRTRYTPDLRGGDVGFRPAASLSH